MLSVQKLYEAVITSHSFHNLSERSQLRKCIQSPTNKGKHELLMRIVEPFNKERHELQMRIIQPPRRITESLFKRTNGIHYRLISYPVFGRNEDLHFCMFEGDGIFCMLEVFLSLFF